MSKTDGINDGGPAFPVGDQSLHPLLIGMSLRDYFAGQALLGMAAARDFMNELSKVSESKDVALEHLARWSYKAADAMLKARIPQPLSPSGGEKQDK